MEGLEPVVLKHLATEVGEGERDTSFDMRNEDDDLPLPWERNCISHGRSS
jgi:hypothetical protein